MVKKLLTINFLALLLLPVVAFSQAKLTGKVTDATTGETLPGANVLIAEIQRGTATNQNGTYTIDNLPLGTYKVTASFVGYVNKEITYTIEGGENVLNIALEPDFLGLDEVVVTGYTQQSRNKVTGAVATVEKKNIDLVPVASFDQILQGQSAGLYVTSGSGQPGSSSNVLIRGAASINGSTQPLYIVDGIPITGADFATLNPNDFESVNVLKDASSTAEYGSRGTNGVILVTTKRGKAGKTQVNYQSQFGISTIGDARFEMMDTQQKLAYEELIQRGPGWDLSPNNPNSSVADPAQRAQDLAELQAINNDWTDIFFRDGTTQTHEVNVSGGNARTRYYMSGNIFNQEGIGIRSGLERYTFRTNLDFSANDNLDMGMNFQIGYSESQFTESEAGVALANPFAAAYLANPYEVLRNDDGTIAVGGGKVGANAYDRLDKDLNDRNEIKVLGKTYVKYQLGDFQFGGDLAIDFREREFNRWINPESFAGGNVANGNQGSLAKDKNRFTRVTSLLSVNYQKTFADIHNVTVFAANELITEDFNSFGYTGYGLNAKLPNTPAAITPGSPTNNMIPPVRGGLTGNALWSNFVIATYSLSDTYNIKANFRRDGSSRFGDNNRYALLGSIGASWVISNEGFLKGLKDNKVVDNLVVRYSYGTTGSQAGIGNFEKFALFAAADFAGEQTIVPTTPGNDNLQWETATKQNLGIDFGLLDNRVSGTLDLYYELTENLFINQQLSRTSGFTGLDVNAGSMSNQGVELGVNVDLLRTKDMVLTARANYAYNLNTIEDLGQVDEFILGTGIVREGLPLGSHFVVDWAGVDPATGAPLYRDADGNVTTTFSNDFQVANSGTWIPPTTGGFGLDYTWGNLSVRTQFNFAQGNRRFNNQTFFQENPNFAQFNLSTIMNTMWTTPGDITEIQGIAYPRQFSSKDIEDASFLRFRNLLIAYTVPGKWFNNTIRGARVFVQGQNLYTWTRFTGFDPEDSNNIASYEYPLPRIYTFGIDINF